MSQLTLTDDRITEATADTNAPENSEATIADRTRTPIEDHPSVANVDLEGMELETSADGWRKFPHPDDIHSHLEEDMDADTACLPAEVRDAIDEITDDPDLGEFLVFDAADAYEYLEELQRQSDLHLENFHRQQLIINQLSNGRGYAKGSSLSTYDKKWICQWEVRRRLAERDFDKWGDPMNPLSKENRGLPNAE